MLSNENKLPIVGAELKKDCYKDAEIRYRTIYFTGPLLVRPSFEIQADIFTRSFI